VRNREKVEVRSELLDRLRLELVGPNNDNEVLDESPSSRYLTGILWPAGTEISSEEDDDRESFSSGEDNSSFEFTAPLLKAMNPSSIGVSLLVKKNCSSLKLDVKWGIYTKTHENGEPKNNSSRWKRTPKSETITLKLADSKDEHRKRKPIKKEPGVFLEYVIRELQDKYAVSLFLVNRKGATDPKAKDESYIFQPVIFITGDGSEPYPFCERKIQNDSGRYRPNDVLSDELLYEENRVFATGHGTSVQWELFNELRTEVGMIKTVTMPSYEVPLVIPPEWTGEGSLNMKILADADNGQQLYDYLSPLCDSYDAWIKKQKKLLKNIDPELFTTAERHSNNCDLSLKRMRKGLKMITSNKSENEKKAFLAFKFANNAMSMQRTYSIWGREARKRNNWSEGPTNIKTEWRPFQIAFFLQSLTGIVNPEDSDREVTDLLWFPTGGGKTEAYLGLTAFTIAIRRLRGDQDGLRADAGVTVLMRYTLRLLTIQQFQRATVLICACEVIRRENVDLFGSVPFRIGLWVGGSSTPNSFDDTIKYFDKIRDGKLLEADKMPSPVQLVTCPWCGSTLVNENKPSLVRHTYFADSKKRRLFIYCSRKECEFSRFSTAAEGIPAIVSDEEIYRLAPTLMIGTVDKFARMPWVGDAQTLFGKVAGEIAGWGFFASGVEKTTGDQIRQVLTSCKKQKKVEDTRELLPPDLIIQDELHLISGPLGTMVGLYESAVDYLCTRKIKEKRIGPKIVASTATIRRAEDQVRALFNRKLAIFPGPGLRAGDSYFAVQQPLEVEPGRLYAGIFAPGKSMKTALLRIYATLLASINGMENPNDHLDPYYTMVGYFNSLRELGGAVRLIEDDVRSRMDVLEKRQLGQHFKFLSRKYENNVPELTSRVNSKDIPGILANLEKSYTDKNGEAVDIVLASNMISVGVDVSRLGLMVVNGQPKTTSEYIQATSRVGREFPGLVITLYNWARPRDVSHYEQFHAYHESLYRYVEAISVTPFASRARDRALAATFISACRHGINGLAKREDAKKFLSSISGLSQLEEAFIARVDGVERHNTARVQEVLQDLKIYAERWENAAVNTSSLVYSNNKDGENLMKPLGKDDGGLFGVPNSMRDVEPVVGIFLKGE
jgi:hypothetical protein